MKALQLVQPRYFHLVQAANPGISPETPGSLLIHTEWISICGSDIPIFTGSKREMTFPYLAGASAHECVGRVMDSHSSQFQPGDLVLAIPDEDQGLAEYFVTQESRAIRLPLDLERYDTCCLIQPLSTVLNAVDRLGDVSGRLLAVVGLGSIGLLFCFVLKQRGALRVIGIDPCQERCRLAGVLGADVTYPMKSSEAVHLARLDGRQVELPEIVIEAVGHQTGTINDCLNLVRHEGTVLAFGVPDEPVYPVEFEIFFRKNVRMLGVVTPQWTEYLPRARDLFFANRETLEKLFTHHLPIASPPGSHPTHPGGGRPPCPYQGRKAPRPGQ